jgi:D-alanyl-D-alanine endopeptidase (penicillin-binding protein 7)
MKFRLLALVLAIALSMAGVSIQAHAKAARSKARPVAAMTKKNSARAARHGHPVAARHANKALRTAAKTRRGPARKPRAAARAPARPSEGQRAGLRTTADPLALKSSVALVVDQDTDEVLFAKNPDAVLPIASITKLMTSLVTVEAGLPLDEELEVTGEDTALVCCGSKLRPGMRMTRAQALQLALMASENHAAHMLGRTYPGGIPAFIDAMNTKASAIGMTDSKFADPTGLNAENRSNPADLVKLVKAAYEHQAIREYSVSHELELPVGKRNLSYANTNRLTSNPDWQIGLQKTGYISAAGRCLVMQAVIEGRRVVMVLLDSVGKYSRIGDAVRLRNWIAEQTPAS